MKVMVTGAKGQLGYDVVNELIARGHEAIGVDIEDLDITDESMVKQTIDNMKPDAVVHCAAWTAVDAAEDKENQAVVKAVNVDGTEYIAKACKEVDAKMIYISSDYVFNGTGEEPWCPDDQREPLSVYGQTKYEGEVAVEKCIEKFFIVRIAWVFGVNGNNFVKTMLNLGKSSDRLMVVNDQIGTPTYTHDLSKLLVDMLNTEKYGIYHATNEGGYISWYDFTCEIIRQAGKMNDEYKNVSVDPCGSDAFPAKANRPSNSRLCKDKLVNSGFKALPDWQDALARFLNQVEV